MTQEQTPLTDTPKDLVAEFSLAVGSTYIAQFFTAHSDPIHLFEAADAPTGAAVSTRGFQIDPGAFWQIEPKTGLKVWAWVPTGVQKGFVEINDA